MAERDVSMKQLAYCLEIIMHVAGISHGNPLNICDKKLLAALEGRGLYSSDLKRLASETLVGYWKKLWLRPNEYWNKTVPWSTAINLLNQPILVEDEDSDLGRTVSNLIGLVDGAYGTIAKLRADHWVES